MLRSRKKDVNIKPNRKLDKRSSRGMLYENEELRLRTIEINAEVERGQCDLKKLRRENQRLRRDIWSLREEYERLEGEMSRMRKGVEGVQEEGKTVVRRRYEDEEEDEEEDEDFDGDEEDEEEENAENLQKVNYYNSGRLSVEVKGEESQSPEAAEVEVAAGGSQKWTGSKLSFTTAAPVEETSQPSTPSSSTSALPCPAHQPSPPCTALLEATNTPELTMRDIFASLSNRLDSIVGVRLLSAPGATSALALISVRSPQDLEALLRTGIEIRGNIYALSDASTAQPCDTVAQRVCKESELGSVKEEDEGVEETAKPPTFARLSSSACGSPRTRSPSPAPHSLSLPTTPLPSTAASPTFPGRQTDKQLGHFRSASADAANGKQRVNFEETCAGGQVKGKRKNGILRRNTSQGDDEHICKHLQRSLSLDPRASFRRRKASERSNRGCEEGGSGVEADSEASRRSITGGVAIAGIKDGSSKDLPWCGCWGNGCF